MAFQWTVSSSRSGLTSLGEIEGSRRHDSGSLAGPRSAHQDAKPGEEVTDGPVDDRNHTR